MATGKVVQIIGTVVDVEFAPDQLPNLFDALTLDNAGEQLVLEVHRLQSLSRSVDALRLSRGQ